MLQVSTQHPDTFTFHTAVSYAATQAAAAVVATGTAATIHYVTDMIAAANTAGSITVLGETTAAVNKAIFRFPAGGGTEVFSPTMHIRFTGTSNIGITTDMTASSITLIGYTE